MTEYNQLEFLKEDLQKVRGWIAGACFVGAILSPILPHGFAPFGYIGIMLLALYIRN